MRWKPKLFHSVITKYKKMNKEIVIGFLAVIKIGGISVPIFSGFGAHALASRLEIAGAKTLLTADGSTRRDKTVEIKKEVDKAVDTVIRYGFAFLVVYIVGLRH